MSESKVSSDWRQLQEFAGVDLTPSRVLAWHIEADSLKIDIELLLAPEHPFYETPRPTEKACIRPAIVEFACCESLGRDDGSCAELVEIPSNLGNGAISRMRRPCNARYEIAGEFGTVFVDAERPVLKLTGP